MTDEEFEALATKYAQSPFSMALTRFADACYFAELEYQERLYSHLQELLADPAVKQLKEAFYAEHQRRWEAANLPAMLPDEEEGK